MWKSLDFYSFVAYGLNSLSNISNVVSHRIGSEKRGTSLFWMELFTEIQPKHNSLRIQTVYVINSIFTIERLLLSIYYISQYDKGWNKCEQNMVPALKKIKNECQPALHLFKMC